MSVIWHVLQRCAALCHAVLMVCCADAVLIIALKIVLQLESVSKHDRLYYAIHKQIYASTYAYISFFSC